MLFSVPCTVHGPVLSKTEETNDIYGELFGEADFFHFAPQFYYEE